MASWSSSSTRHPREDDRHGCSASCRPPVALWASKLSPTTWLSSKWESTAPFVVRRASPSTRQRTPSSQTSPVCCAASSPVDPMSHCSASASAYREALTARATGSLTRRCSAGSRFPSARHFAANSRSPCWWRTTSTRWLSPSGCTVSAASTRTFSSSPSERASAPALSSTVSCCVATAGERARSATFP